MPGEKLSAQTLMAASEMAAEDLVYIAKYVSPGVYVPRAMTAAEWKAYINTDPTVVPSSEPAKLLRVQRSTNLSIANATSTAVTWESSQKDTTGGQLTWSAGAPTRIMVGAGVTKLIARTSLNWAINSTGARLAIIRKGGSAGFGEGYDGRNAVGNSLVTIQHAETAVLDVVAGDYLEVFGYQASGGALNLTAGNNLWFEVEIIEATV